jgi:hypothetical protein
LQGDEEGRREETRQNRGRKVDEQHQKTPGGIVASCRGMKMVGTGKRDRTGNQNVDDQPQTAPGGVVSDDKIALAGPLTAIIEHEHVDRTIF